MQNFNKLKLSQIKSNSTIQREKKKCVLCNLDFGCFCKYLEILYCFFLFIIIHVSFKKKLDTDQKKDLTQSIVKINVGITYFNFSTSYPITCDCGHRICNVCYEKIDNAIRFSCPLFNKVVNYYFLFFIFSISF